VNRVRHLIVGLLLCAAAAHAAAPPPPVAEIRFAGNKVTRESILRQEITFAEGDRASADAIERSRQALMDLGLFQSVKTTVESGAAGRVVTYTVEEKFYRLPLPRLDANAEGGYTYGAEVRFDNLYGLNQRLKLAYRQEESGDGDAYTQREYSVDYSYPRVGGSGANLDLGLSLDNHRLDAEEGGAAGLYEANVRSVRLGGSRWLQPHGPSHGWRGGLGINWAGHAYNLVDGSPGLLESSQSVALTMNVDFRGTYDRGTYRSGRSFGVQAALGLAELGSDWAFSRNQYYYRRYIPLGVPAENLNIQVRVGLANGENFGGVAYGRGGADLLRGYDDEAEGNALVLANFEYLRPLFGHQEARLAAFVDVGNVYPGVLETDLTDLESAAGIGLRWVLESFVNVTLRADVAYGFGSRETHTYLLTSQPF
jgi:outer membrane protein assembly factor BamA